MPHVAEVCTQLQNKKQTRELVMIVNLEAYVLRVVQPNILKLLLKTKDTSVLPAITVRLGLMKNFNVLLEDTISGLVEERYLTATNANQASIVKNLDLKVATSVVPQLLLSGELPSALVSERTESINNTQVTAFAEKVTSPRMIKMRETRLKIVRRSCSLCAKKVKS